MEGKGRGAELKQQQGEEKGKEVKDIMKSITNVRNDRAKKDQAKKWSNMPAETKGKVLSKWEEKAKAAKWEISHTSKYIQQARWLTSNSDYRYMLFSYVHMYCLNFL